MERNREAFERNGEAIDRTTAVVEDARSPRSPRQAWAQGGARARLTPQPSSNTSSGSAAETSALGASTTSEIRSSAATLIKT